MEELEKQRQDFESDPLVISIKKRLGELALATTTTMSNGSIWINAGKAKESKAIENLCKQLDSIQRIKYPLLWKEHMELLSSIKSWKNPK